MGRHKKDTSHLSSTGRLALIVGGLFLGLVLCRIFIIPCHVSESAMSPTFISGNRVFFFRFGKPSNGDIVLIKSPVQNGYYLVRRIIAVEGDGVEIKDREIYVNGTPFQRPWLQSGKDNRSLAMSFTYRDNMPFIKLERGQVFVMGDNRDETFDSRSFGPVQKKAIKGTLLYALH